MERQDSCGADLRDPLNLDRVPEMQRDEISVLMNVYGDLAARIGPDGAPILSLSVEGALLRVTVVLRLPQGYPTYEGLNVELRSEKGSKAVLRDLEDTLQQECDQQFEHGAFSVFSLLCRATELVRDVPLELQSSDFCCCVKCNARLAARDKPKTVRACVRDDAGQWRCVTCKDSAGVIYYPFVRPMDKPDQCCSFCFCEDNPYVYLECGCCSCIGCFQRFVALATGSNQFKKHIRTKYWGVGCPNHATVVIGEPGLAKLLDGRSFLRFNNFIFGKLCEDFEITRCPLPKCISGHPFITDFRRSILRCPFCLDFFCPTCQTSVLQCKCEAMAPRTPVSTEIIRRNLLNGQIPTISSKCPPTVTVKILSGSNDQYVVTLNTQCTNWMAALMAECYALRVLEQPVFIFSGMALSPTRPLREYGVFPGALLFSLEYYPQNVRLLDEELDLWMFRKSMSSGSTYSLESSAGKLFKNCPFCSKPVSHYHLHGCHHIGAHGSCCGRHWCFVCKAEYNPSVKPCGCPLFCDPAGKCGCIPCPDCKPMRPCVLCTGCSICKIADAEFS